MFWKPWHFRIFTVVIMKCVYVIGRTAHWMSNHFILCKHATKIFPCHCSHHLGRQHHIIEWFDMAKLFKKKKFKCIIEHLFVVWLWSISSSQKRFIGEVCLYGLSLLLCPKVAVFYYFRSFRNAQSGLFFYQDLS